MMLPICGAVTQISMALWQVAWRVYSALSFRKGRRR
jgi:hypothetical protein